MKPKGTKPAKLTDNVAEAAATYASRTVSVAEAKRDFSELCARAGYGHEKIVVTKHGRPIAAIIGMEDLERAKELEDRYLLKVMEWAIATSRGTSKVNIDDVL